MNIIRGPSCPCCGAKATTFISVFGGHTTGFCNCPFAFLCPRCARCHFHCFCRVLRSNDQSPSQEMKENMP